MDTKTPAETQKHPEACLCDACRGARASERYEAVIGKVERGADPMREIGEFWRQTIRDEREGQR